MITEYKPIPEFLGLITHVDPSQVPLGGALQCSNLAQFNPGRIRRIPGVAAASSAAVDAATQIPLAFWATGLGAGGADQLIAVFVGVSTVSVVNLSTGSAMTGPALAAPSFGKPWSFTFYNNKWMFAGGGNTSIYQLDSASAYAAVTGTPTPPGGNIIRSFLNRLYIADISGLEGLAQYSDSLTTNFVASNLVNVKELAGSITAMAVNSPSTDTEGIETDLVIFKKNYIWTWNETRKDVVSQVIGTKALHTTKNTKAGLIFLGREGNRASVFLLPLGTVGEPKDIGEQLNDLFNGATVLVNEHLAHAVVEGRFYKLFYSVGSEATNPHELWLDVYELINNGRVIWYGPHTRGSFDTSAAGASSVDLLVRGVSGATKRYQEKTDLTSGFTDSSGNVLSAVLDLPLNVEPVNEEKVYDLLDVQVAKEANIAGNSITYEPISEGTSQGTASISIYTAASALSGISRVPVPIRQASRTGMTALDARIKLTHALNMRFDILSAAVQYLRHEGKERVRKTI